MSDTTNTSQPALERLLGELVEDLRPVKRVQGAWLRALVWLSLLCAIAIVLATKADLPAIVSRLAATSDMWMAVAGSCLTAVSAAIATLQLSLPDRRPTWALLPLPGLALWIGASGLGCARTWLVPDTQEATLAETASCLKFIVGLSLPLSLVLFLLLRRGYSMYPALTGALAGLAAAAAAATLLTFFHPFDATITDLAIHGLAVAFVITLNRLLGGRLLQHRRTRSGTRTRTRTR